MAWGQEAAAASAASAALVATCIEAVDIDNCIEPEVVSGREAVAMADSGSSAGIADTEVYSGPFAEDS